MAKFVVVAVVFAMTLGANRVARGQDISTPAAPAPTKEPIASDLQGRWKLQTAQVALEDEFGKSIQKILAGLVLTVDGGKLQFENSGGGTRSGRILECSRGDDVTKIDFTTGDTTRFGIYRVDDGELRIAFSSVAAPKDELRPVDFRLDNPRSGHVLLKFSRIEAEESRGVL